MLSPRAVRSIAYLALILNELINTSNGLQLFSSSSFCGQKVHCENAVSNHRPTAGVASLTMRKQKASDRRTRRLQRGGDDIAQDMINQSLQRTITSMPMTQWNYKSRGNEQQPRKEKSGGRGRSRKRSTLYHSLSSYHSKFLNLLTAEYKAEEDEVVGRIKASVDDPLALEEAGHALYDMYPERRGNLFADEVYRLTKAKDATVSYIRQSGEESPTGLGLLPPNHKFSKNDVIILTKQGQGSGDFFDPSMLPTSGIGTTLEARVIASGPTYIDIAISGGAFSAAFGPPQDNSGQPDPSLRLRADRFFSSIPYTRMIAAITQLTAIPERKKEPSIDGIQSDEIVPSASGPYENICMDEVLKEAIIATHAFADSDSPMFHDMDVCNLEELGRKLSKPPMPSSVKLANQVLAYIQNNPHNVFATMNAPQLAAIGAALTRKLTLIQGPPGTGKTLTASAIAFGFTHQCRSISSNAKVLACAFSNVGSDNLADGFLRLGLKVVRVGKPSAVSEHLWDYTLDAAIERDPDAQAALQNAARATAQLAKVRSQKRGHKNSVLSERMAQELATTAVKQSIKACNIAATKALREADVVVSTSTGASDPRILAACGLPNNEEDVFDEDGRLKDSRSKRNGSLNANKSAVREKPTRLDAPDGLPPISFPYVIVDEACQSVEPGTLIPLTASNSCRSMVFLGDPCQLPATVKNDPTSELSISLMERLAAILPQPATNMQIESIDKDTTFLDSLPIKQARSLLRTMESSERSQASYRRRFAGSLLLSVQYRMHPSISAFSSAIFYDGLLSTPSFLARERPFPRVLKDTMPCGNRDLGVRFINVGGRCNEMRGELNVGLGASSSLESKSYFNEAEASTVLSVIKRLVGGNVNDNTRPKTIGVVTPYSGQVRLVSELIANDDELRSIPGILNTIEVKSVDGYQGRERDVIIFSAVRSNRHSNVGFLSDWRRLNVAMTRARDALIVVGDMETLTEGDKHWAALAKWCEGVRCVIDDTEDPDECASV